MKATETTRRYHDTWNNHDADALVACFTKDGTYCSPDTPPIGGEALASFVEGVWTAVPDFSVEMLNGGEIEPGVVAHHWVVRGTDAVRPDGSKPTGRAFTFKELPSFGLKETRFIQIKHTVDRKALDKRLEPG
jgi:SnoaL-like polyketide cyclase